MKYEILLGSLAGVVLLASATHMNVAAQQQQQLQQQQRQQLQADEPIFGNQMMTEQERLQYRARMRSATTAAERERVRAEHHERMVRRARERGITLPDEPPIQEGGRGPGGGLGGGGPGGGSRGGR